MNQYAEFLDAMWSSDVQRYATIDGREVRILIGRISNDYANAYGTSLIANSVEITVIKDELGTWKPKPNAKLSINNRQYQVYQDIPVQNLDCEDTLLKIVVHPV